MTADYINDVRYPEIDVQLTGTDSNAFSIMGEVSRALKAHGVPKADVDEFRVQAMSGDYNNLLQTCMKWVNVS